MSLTPPTIIPLTRRRFLAAAGATVLAAKASSLPDPTNSAPRFAYTASPGELRVYATQTIPWTQLQSVASEAPISLAIDTHTHTLHVLHDVAEHLGLPRGYIESFRIDQRTGRLAPLYIQPLSLSATHPRHMALSPDGKTLAVAIHGGSAYNLLPVLEDGRPGRPTAIRKETGFDPSLLSRPSQIAFSLNGDHLFALDHGTATLSIFAAEPGLPILARFPLPAGCRRSHFALDPQGSLLFLTDSSTGSLLTLKYDSSGPDIRSIAILQGDFLGPLTFHTPTQTLFAATRNGLAAVAADSGTGKLATRQQLLLLPSRFSYETHQLILAYGGNRLLTCTANGVVQCDIDSASNNLCHPEVVAVASHSAASL
jgi:hypothetical protein